jgi:hypothetical protein
MAGGSLLIAAAPTYARAGAVAPIGLLARGYVVDSRIERAPSVASIRRALDDVAAVAS